MGSLDFPVIDMIATGKNILSLRREKGFTVRDLQEFFGFEEPQAIYRDIDQYSYRHIWRQRESNL